MNLIAPTSGVCHRRTPRANLRLCPAGTLYLTIALLLIGLPGCKKSSPPAPEGTGSGSAPGASSSAESQGQAQPGSLVDRLNAVQSGAADAASTPKLPAWKTLGAGVSSPKIPWVKGLVVVAAVTDPAVDYEPISTIEEASDTAVQVHVSADKPAPKMTGLLGGAEKGLADPKNMFPDKVDCLVQIDAADLAKSHNYREFVCENKREHFPGTNPAGASREMLEQLRAGQEAEFNFSPDSPFAALAQLGAQLSGHKTDGPALTQHAGLPMYSCSLHRVGTADVAFPVLLNDQRVELPALHAMCTFPDGEESHIYYLDQLDNPMALADQLGLIPQLTQVIKITLPPPQVAQTPSPANAAAGANSAGNAAAAGPSQMEQALAAKKAVEVYGIYFDFNSATIKPESEAVLLEIAGIMRKNSDWKLSVSGHTDNIGEDSFNLGLSQRRAAAVKDALVARYKISPNRLATSGYGASQPIETNKTMEGRARNRRVELQRQ